MSFSGPKQKKDYFRAHFAEVPVLR